MFTMLRNTPKDGLCYQRSESVSMKVFLLHMYEVTDFSLSGQAYTSFNLLRILNFSYESYWPRLASSSKCRGSVSHGDIKFWFSGNANTGIVTDHVRKKLRQRGIRITCYILIFLICWTPALVITAVVLNNAEKDYNHKKHYNAKKYSANDWFIFFCSLQVALAPLQGFLNSLVYGWSRRSFRSASGRRSSQYEAIEGFSSTASFEDSTEVERVTRRNYTERSRPC